MAIAVIDADIIAYQASSVGQTTIDWGDGDGPVATVDERKAADIAIHLVKKWMAAAKCKQSILVLSDRDRPQASFRYQVWPAYKSNRKEEDRPDLLNHVLKVLRSAFDTLEFAGLEGDDVIGLLMTGTNGQRYHSVSIDKDLLTIPGVHWNSKSGIRSDINTEKANYNRAKQALIGDTVDGYLGIPGIGPVSAEQILSTCRSAQDFWLAVLGAAEAQIHKPKWKRHYGQMTPRDMALSQMRLAHILRAGDYKHSQGNVPSKVRLWTPPGEEEEWIDGFRTSDLSASPRPDDA